MNPKQNLEKLKKWAEDSKSKGFDSFDWETKTFKMSEGKQLVRILPPKDEGIMFLADGYHIMSSKYYQDCKDPKECPVCKLLRVLWQDDDTARKATYRELKRRKRFTYQIVLLNDDGTPVDGVAKLWTAPKTVHDIVLAYVMEKDSDVTDLEEGRNFMVVKKKGSDFFDYSESYFEDDETEFEFDEDDLLSLDEGKYYKYEKALPILNKLKNQFNLDF